MIRIPHIDLPAGNSTAIHLYNWTPKMLGHVYNLTAAADVLSVRTGLRSRPITTPRKRMCQSEGGFGNQTGPRGIGGGSNPTGGEYTEKITGRVMQGMKEFLTIGRMRWCWNVLAHGVDHEGCCVVCVGAIRVSWVPDGAEELRAGEEECKGAMTAFPISQKVMA
ncbi:MAG: hypothetical protein KAU52_01995 [Methanosarcinales archaeon]|nr:hypothetical protein [Methanosarcinales archaeon]